MNHQRQDTAKPDSVFGRGLTLGDLALSRFSSDVLWNLGSLVFLGISGLAFNALVGRYYGPDALGIFNQVLALYLLLSQVAVGGFMFSTLSLTGASSDAPEVVGKITSSALILTAISAGVVCILAALLSASIGEFLNSPNVGVGLRWVLPGLWCFALNKTLLFSLNGMRAMRAYAVGQSLRFIFAFVIIVVLVLSKADSAMLAFAIAGGEILLLPLLVLYVRTRIALQASRSLLPYFSEHLRFAKKCYFSGLLLDVNTKVDIIILGYFLSDSVVGVYSFAAMLVEGFFQIVIVVQSNVTPLLSQMRIQNQHNGVPVLLRSIARILIPVLLLITCIGTALFSFGSGLLTGNPEFDSGWIYFMLLMIGVSLSSAHLSFTMILNQWGRPGWFTIYLLLTVIVNIVLNSLFIPLWGATGSALATGSAFLLSAYILTLLSSKILGISLWSVQTT